MIEIIKTVFFSAILPLLILFGLYYILNYKPKNYYSFSSLKIKDKLITSLKAFFISFYFLFFAILLFLNVLVQDKIAYVLFLIILMIFYLISKLIELKKEKANNKKLGFTHEYIRELPKLLTITEISFLDNKKLEIKKDLKTTILNLYYKGAIDIIESNGNVVFNKTNNNINLNYGEKYIYDYLFSENKNEFNIYNWQKEVQKEIFEDELALNKRDYNLTKLFFIFISIIFISLFAFIIVKTSQDETFVLDQNAPFKFLFIASIIIPIYLYENANKLFNLKLTIKGSAYKYNVRAFKKFLKEFTRIDEVKLKEYPLWKEYLIYAQTLGINVDYKKFPDVDMKLLDNKDIKIAIEKFVYNITQNIK